MNATAVLARSSSASLAHPRGAEPTTAEPTTAELATALQDLVDRLLQAAPAVRATAQPLCLCWVESRD